MTDAFTSPEITRIRYKGHAIVGATLDIMPLIPVTGGTMAGVPMADEYPAGDYTVTLTTEQTTTWALGRQDMVVEIFRPSLDNRKVFTGILRRNNILNPGSHTLRIAFRQVGDTGNAEFDNLNIEPGDEVIVYANRMPRSFVSRIDTEGIFYKLGDVIYATGAGYQRKTQYPEPQVNLGTHLTLWADPETGIATYCEDASNSFSWNENSLNYEWQVDGVTLVDEGAPGIPPPIDTPDICIDYDLGWHIMNCQVEDSVTEHVKRGYRVRHVIDGVTEKAFSQKYDVEITGDNTGLLGRTMKFRVTVGANAPGDDDVMQYFYPGALVIFHYPHKYYDGAGAQFDAPDGVIEHYVGYVRQVTPATDSDRVDVFDVLVQSPMEFSAALPIPPQTVQAADPPNSWAEAHPDLMNLAWFIWYLLEYHVPVNQKLHDYYPGDLTLYKKFAFSSKGSTIQAAVRESIALAAFGSNIGCDSDGTCWLKLHPWYASDDFRDAVLRRWDMDPVDILQVPGQKPINYNYNQLMRVGETEGSGIVTGVTLDAAAYTARAGVLSQMHGPEKLTMPGFIALSQEDIQDIVGHRHAAVNTPVESLSLSLFDGMDFIEPAKMEIVTFNASVQAFDPAHSDVLKRRMLPVAVERRWELIVDEETGARDLTCIPTVTFVPETRGWRAPLKPVDSILIPGGWCYTWDFALGDGGWSIFRPDTFDGLDIAFWEGSSRGSYSAGYWRSASWTGSSGGYGTNRDGLAIRINITPDTVVTGIDFEIFAGVAFGTITAMVGGVWRVTGVQSNGPVITPTGNQVISVMVPEVACDRIGVYIAQHSSTDIPLQALIAKVTARGKGANPFGGANNCV